MWFLQRFRSDPVCSRNYVRSGLDVQRRSQVDDRQLVANLEASFELQGGDASPPKMAKEALSVHIL
jgi:hypothetical protein